MSNARGNSFQSHIGHSQFPQRHGSLNEVQRNVGHGVSGEIETDNVVGMPVQEDRNRLKVSSG